MPDTRQLLTEHARNASETAFRELVTRYADLVYAAAAEQWLVSKYSGQ